MIGYTSSCGAPSMPGAASGTSISRKISSSRAACWAVPRNSIFSPVALLVICIEPSGVLNASAGMPSIWRIVGIAASNVRYFSANSRRPAVPMFGLLDGVDDRANRPQPAGRFRDLNLPRLRQRDDFALRAQQRLHLLGGLFGRHVPHREQHANQLVFAALVELGQRHVGHQIRRNAVFEIHEHEHPAAADERVALGQQHAVEHVERFGGRVASRVAVVERAGRRRFHQQRQAGLLGEPIQHFLPRLVAEIERELGVVGRLGAAVGATAACFRWRLVGIVGRRRRLSAGVARRASTSSSMRLCCPERSYAARHQQHAKATQQDWHDVDFGADHVCRTAVEFRQEPQRKRLARQPL